MLQEGLEGVKWELHGICLFFHWENGIWLRGTEIFTNFAAGNGIWTSITEAGRLGLIGLVEWDFYPPPPPPPNPLHGPLTAVLAFFSF